MYIINLKNFIFLLKKKYLLFFNEQRKRQKEKISFLIFFFFFTRLTKIKSENIFKRKKFGYFLIETCF